MPIEEFTKGCVHNCSIKEAVVSSTLGELLKGLYDSELTSLIGKGNAEEIINYLEKIEEEKKFGVFGKDVFMVLFDSIYNWQNDLSSFKKCYERLNLFSGLDGGVISHMIERIDVTYGEFGSDSHKIRLANAILSNMKSFENINIVYQRDASGIKDGNIIIRLGGVTFPTINYFRELPEDFMRIIKNSWGNDIIDFLIEKDVDGIIKNIRSSIENILPYLSEYEVINLKSTIANMAARLDVDEINVNKLLDNQITEILNIEDRLEKIKQLKDLNSRIFNFAKSSTRRMK